MPYGIRLLYHYRLGKNIRSEALSGGKAEEFEKLHTKKQGTPTMGGLIMIVAIMLIIIISIVMQTLEPQMTAWFGFGFSNSLWNRQETYIIVSTLLGVGAIGAIDDYLNIRGIGRTKGLSARVKMGLLILLAFFVAYWFYFRLEYNQIHIPFLGNVQVGFAYVFFSVGIKKTPALLACLITAMEPVLNPIWVILATGEKPGSFAIAGGAVIVLTVIAYNIWVEKTSHT
jgi:UDP-N-acetylmuramyl pentapeptide phosphotransferase/UDP-N-acetylglucosamine-1-phosphate transferase